jgi:hypothetical protein
MTSVGFLRCLSDPAIYCSGNKKGDRLVVGCMHMIWSSQEAAIKRF